MTMMKTSRLLDLEVNRDKEKFYVVLYDEDGTIGPVESVKRFTGDGTGVADVNGVKAGNMTFKVEIIYVGGKTEGENLMEAWPNTHRGQAIMAERVRRHENNMSGGGYLAVWPAENDDEPVPSTSQVQEDAISTEPAPSTSQDPSENPKPRKGKGKGKATKKRKANDNEQQQPKITRKGDFPPAATDDTQMISLQRKDYLDFMDNAEISSQVQDFMKSGKVVVEAAGRINKACCDHCFLIPQLNARLDRIEEAQTNIIALLTDIKESVRPSVPVGPGPTTTLPTDRPDSLSNMENPSTIAEAPSNSSLELSLLDELLDASAVSEAVQSTLPDLSVGGLDAAGSSIADPPASQPCPPEEIVISSGGQGTSEAPVDQVISLPSSVRVGKSKVLIDMGCHKGDCEFTDSSCSIPDNVIASVQEKADMNIGNFCCTLVMALYGPMELVGRAVDGSSEGKLPISPRRRAAIKSKSMEAFSVPLSQRQHKWRECREAINKKLRRLFKPANNVLSVRGPNQ